MKRLKGGFDIRIVGRPSAIVQTPPEPSTLFIPLRTRRFHFSEIVVQDNTDVTQGTILACDPKQFNVPLLASRGGTIHLDRTLGQIVIDKVKPVSAAGSNQQTSSWPHAPSNLDSSGQVRFKLLKMGAWQYFKDAATGLLPDPMAIPSALIVSTITIEPFSVRGDVLLKEKLASFTRGLEHLQPLLEYQPIFLVFPKITTELALKIKETIRGFAWIKLVEIPVTYPFDDFRLLARKLGLISKSNKDNVWTLRTEGVLAIDSVLTNSQIVAEKVVAIGGPAVKKPAHFKVPVGYPLAELLHMAECETGSRYLNGGVFSGAIISELQKGIDCECGGITVLSEQVNRSFLKFVTPGFDRRSFAPAFASALRPAFSEKVDTALCGEGRACVNCGFCSKVCPAEIVPSAIHKLVYQSNMDELEFYRPDLCVDCGLCSYVCPSKINLYSEIAAVKMKLREELTPEKAGH